MTVLNCRFILMCILTEYFSLFPLKSNNMGKTAAARVTESEDVGDVC